MSTKKLTNISLKDFRKFLKKAKCEYAYDHKGHEFWVRSDLYRKVTFQAHIEPIPEFVIRNNLKTLGVEKNDFFDILGGRKIVEEKEGVFMTKAKK